MMAFAASMYEPLESLAIMGIRLFHKNTAPAEVRMEYEKPVCSQSERCKDCPYPAHGFVCWHDEGNCLRTEMEKIAEKEKKRGNERNNQQ